MGIRRPATVIAYVNLFNMRRELQVVRPGEQSGFQAPAFAVLFMASLVLVTPSPRALCFRAGDGRLRAHCSSRPPPCRHLAHRGSVAAAAALDDDLRPRRRGCGRASSLGLVFRPAMILLPLARFPALVWIVCAGALLPKLMELRPKPRE